MTESVFQFIQRHAMIRPGDRVLVGVSGGPDSLALLYLLHDLQDRLQCTLHVAHLDHRLRGERSEAEARFVAAQAEALGLPCQVEAIPVAEVWQDASLEAGARAVRYAFFERIAREVRASRIALGHTADDQVETVLMRILRGTGLGGLGGIPPVRGPYIRPLLGTSRESIECYLQEKDLAPCRDETNVLPVYLRNRIRHELLPLLERDYNPNLRQALLRLADLAATDEAFLRTLAAERFEASATVENDGKVTLDRRAVLREHPSMQRRILREMLAHAYPHLVDVHYEHVESVRRLIMGERPNARIDLPGDVRVVRRYDQVICRREIRGEAPGRFEVLLNLPGETLIPGGRIFAEFVEKERDFPKSGWEVLVDAEALQGTPVVRNRRPGDRFQPLGMEGHRKLKDFFIDQKVPPDERERVPLIVNQGEIVWVVGYRLAEVARITPRTRRVIHLRYQPDPAP